MEKLKSFLFGLTLPEREEFAVRCGTTWPHLRNVAYGYRAANEKLASLIEAHSAGAITRKDFYPADWHLIWPELMTEPDAATPAQQEP